MDVFKTFSAPLGGTEARATGIKLHNAHAHYFCQIFRDIVASVVLAYLAFANKIAPTVTGHGSENVLS